MSLSQRKFSDLNNSLESKIKVDFGGFGDCGYRSIFGAFLAAHTACQLTDEQYQSDGLRRTLVILYKLGKQYLPQNFPELPAKGKLDVLINVYKKSIQFRQKLIVDGAEALRQISVENLYTNTKFDGFFVTDENLNTLSGKDYDLKKSNGKKSTTYISAAEIASASDVLHVPVEVINDKGLRKKEVYNLTGSEIPVMTIELSGAHYTARINRNIVDILKNAIEINSEIYQKLKKIPEAVGHANKNDIRRNTPTAYQQTAKPSSIAKNIAKSMTFIEQTNKYQQAEIATKDIEQKYRDQREILKKVVAELSNEQLQIIYAAYNEEDDYLSGNHGLAITDEKDAIHLISTAAWKNPDIAKTVQEALNGTKPEIARQFELEIKLQQEQSILAFRR